MSKIQGQAGTSIADVYDVQGSIVEIDELLDKQGVHLTHEMGSTVFSERVRGGILRRSTGALLQNVAWDITLTLPVGVTRIHRWAVVADVAARTQHCQLSIANSGAGIETDLPFWAWDVATTDIEKVIRMQLAGAAVANISIMQLGLPTDGGGSFMAYGTSQPNSGNAANQLIFRGLTSGFGAGNVTVTAIIFDAFPQLIAPASRGLPIPGW